jgi:hypothetical protein
MKIAVYQGIMDIHYEMCPFIIDYFSKSNNIIVDYYFNESYLVTIDYSNKKNLIKKRNPTDWFDYYIKQFGEINIKSVYDFNPEYYDFIYILTDDDQSFYNEWFINYSNKIISIKHSHLDRTPPVYFNINTRYIINQKYNNWIIPVYIGINKKEKYELIKKSDKIKIVILGKVLIESYIYIQNIFNNIDDIEINIITLSYHHIKKYDFNKIYSKNINININITLDELIDMLKEASYVMITNVYEFIEFNKTENHDRCYNLVLSGVHLGLSHGCHLLLPSSYHNVYSLNISTAYNEYAPIDIVSSDENVLNKKITLERIDENSINNIYQQLYELISHKNYIFDKSILLKNQDYIFNNYREYKYYNIFNTLSIRLPNVYITFDEKYADDGYMFREKYWITDKNINDDNKNINIINNNKFIFTINQPILFVLNNDDKLDTLMMLIGARLCRDIIFIHNLLDYNYKKVYTKMCSPYKIENKIIIIPHK